MQQLPRSSRWWHDTVTLHKSRSAPRRACHGPKATTGASSRQLHVAALTLPCLHCLPAAVGAERTLPAPLPCRRALRGRDEGPRCSAGSMAPCYRGCERGTGRPACGGARSGTWERLASWVWLLTASQSRAALASCWNTRNRSPCDTERRSGPSLRHTAWGRPGRAAAGRAERGKRGTKWWPRGWAGRGWGAGGITSAIGLVPVPPP